MIPKSQLDRLGDCEHTLYLVDISSFIFRAFYAIRALSSSKGEPTNAVFGVGQMLSNLFLEANPKQVAVTYDSKEPSFRKEVYAEYKANRSAPPDDLVPQFARIEQLVRALGIHSYRQSGVEADDLIATLTRRWLARDPANRAVIVTGDKDLMQLVDDRVLVLDTMKEIVFGAPEVEEKFGVPPTLIRDYLALVGDSSDNVPGVPGVGPKTAVDLLKAHGSLDGVLAAAKAGAIAGKKGDTLKAHEKDARLSLELVTLAENIEVKLDEKVNRFEFRVGPELAKLLGELEFGTLLERWIKVTSGGAEPAGEAGAASASAAAPRIEGGSASAAPGVSAQPSDAFRAIDTESALADALAAIERTREFGFDLETTSLNPRQAEIVGVALCYDRAFGTYIPVGHRGTDAKQLPLKLVLERLKPFLENPRYKKIGQNLKYDWAVLREQGVHADGIGADTMVAAYVIDPNGRHNFEALCLKYLEYKVLTYEEVCGKGKDQIGFDQVPVELATRYSAEDALYAVRLWDKLRVNLESERLMEVFARCDLPLVQVLCGMEGVGVRIDTPWLKELSVKFDRELRAIEERVSAFTQGPINLNSPKQLGHLLFEQLKLPTQGKTKTGFSTDASVLEALAPLHEVPRLLLEYREIAKLKGTYVDPLPGMVDPKTGRIHASFHQTVAATGRLSSSDPNLQNIPIRTERGGLIRRAFIPAEGCKLLSCDYSQIELRILAHMSGDPDLTRSFREDEDVHARTASELFGVKPSEVDSRQRGIAKAINFGLMYGKTAFGLAQELKIPRSEAKDIIDRYFTRYAAVKRFLDRLISDAREKGEVETLLGRKRKLPEIHAKNPALRANAERMAMNSPIQGTAADMMKLAMISLDSALKEGGYRSKLIIQVHDELVLECPDDEVREVEGVVKRAMEEAMSLSVPLRVNSASGANWQEL